MNVGMLSGVLVLLSLCAGAREFTGKNGKTLEAEVISKTAREVELKLETGKTVTVPLTSLSDADQLYIELWESPEAKLSRLKEVELDEVLAAKGYVAFPLELRGQFEVVTLQVDGQEVAFMFNHSVQDPIIDQRAVERLGLQMDPAEGGGGGVVGTIKAEKLGNGSEDVGGTRFLVAPVNGIPQGVDGLIGGQFFVDRAVRLDFSAKKLWIKE